MNNLLVELTKSYLELTIKLMVAYGIVPKPPKETGDKELDQDRYNEWIENEWSFMHDQFVIACKKGGASFVEGVVEEKYFDMDVEIEGIVGTFRIHYSGKVSKFKPNNVRIRG